MDGGDLVDALMAEIAKGASTFLPSPNIEWFDGPSMRAVGAVPYITFTSYGVKQEGEPTVDGPLYWTEAEAIYRWKKLLAPFINSAKPDQIAWRRC